MSNIRASHLKILIGAGVLAGIMLAALSIGGHSLLTHTIEAEKASASQINASGRRRMLTQQIAEMAFALALMKEKPQQTQLRAELTAAASEMLALHQALIDGDAKLGLPGNPSPQLKTIYFGEPHHLDRQIEHYIASAKKVAAMQPSDLTAENSHLLDIHKAVTGPLLEAVDTVTRQYQTESEARIAKLQRQEDIVLITKLIVIVLLALVVFWPMVRRIRRDISRLASAEAHTRAIVDNMVDGLISIDEKGIVQSCNPAAERLFGYTAAELPGSNINMLLAESDGRDNDFVAQYCADGKEHLIGVDREVLGQHKDGSTFPVHLAIGAMWLDGNRYFIGIVRDVTDLKQYEQKFIAAREAAELANRAKDSFLATMSHEIRTPLSGMLGSLKYSP